MKMVKPGGRRYRFYHLLMVFLITLVASLLLNSGFLHQWIYRLENQDQKIRLLNFVAPIHRLSVRYHLNEVEEELRGRFLALANWRITRRVRPIKKVYKPDTDQPLPFSKRRPLRVLLVGDSMAGAINFTLTPLCEELDEIDLDVETVVSSTLTNQHFVDWPQKLTNILKQNWYDLAFICLGANSAQGIYLADERRAVVYPTEAWAEKYRERIAHFSHQITATGAQVVWIGLPPMRDYPYREDIRLVEKQIIKACKDEGLELISTRQLLGNADGEYSDWIEIDGVLKRTRTPDGIHFTRTGSLVVSQMLIKWIKDNYYFIE